MSKWKLMTAPITNGRALLQFKEIENKFDSYADAYLILTTKTASTRTYWIEKES